MRFASWPQSLVPRWSRARFRGPDHVRASPRTATFQRFTHGANRDRTGDLLLAKQEAACRASTPQQVPAQQDAWKSRVSMPVGLRPQPAHICPPREPGVRGLCALKFAAATTWPRSAPRRSRRGRRLPIAPQLRSGAIPTRIGDDRIFRRAGGGAESCHGVPAGRARSAAPESGSQLLLLRRPGAQNAGPPQDLWVRGRPLARSEARRQHRVEAGW